MVPRRRSDRPLSQKTLGLRNQENGLSALDDIDNPCDSAGACPSGFHLQRQPGSFDISGNEGGV